MKWFTKLNMESNATYLGANGWLLDFYNARILVDPWLTGELTFPPGPWLLKGELPKQISVPENINLVLLTQGLSDHSHIPTLKLLDRETIVVASNNASKVVKKLGFKTIKILNPGEYYVYKDLNITATAGAKIPSLENGYILSNKYHSIYLEPHGFLDQKLNPQKIDTIISPVVDIGLGNSKITTFIKGKTILPEIIKIFQPKNILASTAGGNIKFSGILSNVINQRGSIKQLKKTLPKGINLIDPLPGKIYSLK
tara:strand:- start:2678 stop:3442 length:765 start_codon:yes stop_codon:yes gene_type:complete